MDILTHTCVCRGIWRLTDSLKGAAVKLVSVHRVLIDLPVPCVHNVAVLAPQDHAATVRNGVRHSDRLAPAHLKFGIGSHTAYAEHNPYPCKVTTCVSCKMHDHAMNTSTESLNSSRQVPRKGWHLPCQGLSSCIVHLI